MRQISYHPISRPALRLVGLLTLVCMLVVGLGLGPLSPAVLYAGEQPQKGGIVVWAVHESMPSFDMHFDTSYILAQPVGPIYNGLVTQDPYNNGKIVGDLAERWEIAEDGKRITFFLHKGVKFHDGTPFTCADAQCSLDKLADRKRTHPTFVTVVEEVYESSHCADDFTLVVSMKRPSAVFMTLLSGAHAAMMKKGIAEAVDRKDTKFLVGTGPFKFKSYTPGVDFQAERNLDYWKPGLPHVEGYRAVVMSRPDQNLRLLPGTSPHHDRHRPPSGAPGGGDPTGDFPDAVVAIGPK